MRRTPVIIILGSCTIISVLTVLVVIVGGIFSEPLVAIRQQSFIAFGIQLVAGLVILGMTGLGFLALWWGEKRYERGHRETAVKASRFISITEAMREIWRELNYKLVVALVIILVFAGLSWLLLLTSRNVLGALELDMLLGTSLTLFGVLVTTLALFYAFRAEDHAEKLLTERGQFMSGFDGFMNRITKKLYEVREEAESGHLNDDEYLWVKCIYLTPFLGHAGLVEGDDVRYANYQDHEAALEVVLGSSRCRVSVLTLNPRALVRWYAHVGWVNAAREISYDERPTDVQLSTLRSDVKELMLNGKGMGSLQIHGSKAVSGFDDKLRMWEDKVLRPEKRSRLSVGMSNGLPFQGCIVTKVRLQEEEDKKWPDPAAFRRVDRRTRLPKEEVEFAIVTLVGSETYWRVIRSIMRGRFGPEEGIEGLLTELHMGVQFHQERFSRIINHHFWQIWNASECNEERWRYSEVGAELWRREELYQFPTVAEQELLI